MGSKNLLNGLKKVMAHERKPASSMSVNVKPGWVKTEMGGSNAGFTAEVAVNNMIENVVKRVTINDSGSFLNYDGSIHPW